MEETNFADLRDIVRQLAQAQLRTEAHLDALTARVDTLALRLGELTAQVDTLALRTDELARAQLRTEHEIARLRRTRWPDESLSRL